MVGFFVKVDTLRDTRRISKKLFPRCTLKRHGAAKHAVLNIELEPLQAGRSDDMVQLVDNFVQRLSLPARGMLVGIHPGWSCRGRCMDGSVEVGCFGEFLGRIHCLEDANNANCLFFVWSVL